MKIRIKGNSVRFRLSKSELDKIGETGYVNSTTSFPTNTLTYAVIVRHDLTQMDVEFKDHAIQLFVPQHLADEWVGTQRVGFDAEIQLKNGETLSLLLEKDFQCLDERGEDESDLYPNPLAQKS